VSNRKQNISSTWETHGGAPVRNDYNKSPEYFWDVFINHAGVMKIYTKDNSGDQASPINGQISGLFFKLDKISSNQSTFIL